MYENIPEFSKCLKMYTFLRSQCLYNFHKQKEYKKHCKKNKKEYRKGKTKIVKKLYHTNKKFMIQFKSRYNWNRLLYIYYEKHFRRYLKGLNSVGLTIKDVLLIDPDTIARMYYYF